MFFKKKPEYIPGAEIPSTGDATLDESIRLAMERQAAKTPIQKQIENIVTSGKGYGDITKEEKRDLSYLEYQVYLGLGEMVRSDDKEEKDQIFAQLKDYMGLSSKLRRYGLTKDRHWHLSDQENIDLALAEVYKYEEPLREREARDKKNQKYTLKEIIGQLTRKGMYREFQNDIALSPLLKGRAKITKNNLLLFASFGAVWSTPHELIHAGVNSLTGGVNKEIVLNRLYGGDLWAQIIPGVEAKVMVPFIGGYVVPEYNNTWGAIATNVAPYALTSLGIYLVQKGRENKSLTVSTLGVGLVAAHVGGIVGDWMNQGRLIVGNTIEGVCHAFGTEPPQDNQALNLAATVGSFYLGAKLMTAAYRISKGSVTSLRQWYAERTSFPQLPPTV